MAQPDQQLLESLARRLIETNPQIKVGIPRDSSMGLLRHLIAEATQGADPENRLHARKQIASLHSPAKKKRLATVQSKALRLATARERQSRIKGISGVQDALRWRGQRQKAAQSMVLFEQEAARRSDIVRRIMKILKTQPGLGMILMALMGGGTAIAGLMGSGGDE